MKNKVFVPGSLDIQTDALEWIIALESFSRFPVFFEKDLLTLKELAQKKKVKLVLEWDILMTECVLEERKKQFENVFSFFDAFRVQDLGALNFLVNKANVQQVQLILDHGNHNLFSLEHFAKVSSKIERLILSPQIPKEILKQYQDKLSCPIEILFLGHLPISYTPRKLLAKHFPVHKSDDVFKIQSKEGQKFVLNAVENQNGTFLIYDHLFTLEGEEQEVASWDKCFFRFDDRFKSLSDKKFSGLFKENKTAELFVHLKNSLIERKDEGTYLGEVVDIHKEHFIGIHLQNPKEVLRRQDLLCIKTPEGRIKELMVKDIKNFLLEKIEEGKHEGIVFIPYLSGVTVRSSVYLLEREKC